MSLTPFFSCSSKSSGYLLNGYSFLARLYVVLNFITSAFLSSAPIHFKPFPMGVSSITFSVYFSIPRSFLFLQSAAFLCEAHSRCFSVCFFSTHFEPSRTLVLLSPLIPLIRDSHFLQKLHCIAVTKSPLKSYSRPRLNSCYFLTVLNFVSFDIFIL